MFHLRKPARSLIKCIKWHGGYNACERCTIKGERYENKIIYLTTNCPKRTDESFRKFEDTEHHGAVISPLLSITPEINMISDFVLDIMHLCYLGIMKKLLTQCWLGIKSGTKMTIDNIGRLSLRLLHLKSEIPIEFQRSTRSIKHVMHWKATEYRFFLLYCGPVVLNGILPTKLYIHYLLFHTACRILCSQNMATENNTEAGIYLERFVVLAYIYYGPTVGVLNMHNLIHLADVVKNMRCTLSEISAFPFENYLGKIKRSIRSGNKCLSQLCRRLSEISVLNNTAKPQMPPIVQVMKIVHRNGQSITKLKYKEFTITCKPPNNIVLLADGSIIMVDNVSFLNNNGHVSVDNIIIRGQILKKADQFLTIRLSLQT